MNRGHCSFKKVIWVITTIYLLFLVNDLILGRFQVTGESMEPSYYDGEHILVGKWIMGTRIYTHYSNTKSIITSIRLPGIRKLKAGDVVVFNYPYYQTQDSITIDSRHFSLKRCIGAPGDSVIIQEGFYLTPDNSIIGNKNKQKELNILDDSLLVFAGRSYYTISRQSEKWTVKNLGPFYIPGKGDRLILDSDSLPLYHKIIKFETGKDPLKESDRNSLYESGEYPNYCFRTNWFFLAGDNVLNSFDSRFFGLIPEELIVGIVVGSRS